MSFEQMGGNQGPSNEQMQMSADQVVDLRNGMQIKLAELHGEDISDFIDNHAGDVARMLRDKPDLLERYLQNPEETLPEVDKIIYH